MHSVKNRLLAKFSVFIGLLMGARVFIAVLLIFALYVSTFFLFNQEETLREFVFDFKVHAIILCSFLSILAGGIINQFYDKEKDQITKPFRTKLQNFIAQKHYLYLYLILNTLSLGIAASMSFRIFIFFLIYQFMMWFYSHKLSKMLIVNNLSFVGLSLYPFFGMLVYYQTFSMHILLMSVYLFSILISIDITKDILTKNADRIFGYQTIANSFSTTVSRRVTSLILLLNIGVTIGIICLKEVHNIMKLYFEIGLFIQIITLILLLKSQKYYSFTAINLLRLWVFVGIISMLVDGIVTYLRL